MMQESQLYDKDGLFHNIIKQSQVMQGRYVVLPNGSSDLNAGNILTGIELPKEKYPVVACLPPVSTVDQKLREYFSFRLLFLTTTVSDGTGAFKQRDHLTNTEQHRVTLNWQDMKSVAISFVYALSELQNKWRNQYFIDAGTPMRITRMANMEKDKVSGVMLMITVGLFMDCEQNDISIGAVDFPYITHNLHNQ